MVRVAIQTMGLFAGALVSRKAVPLSFGRTAISLGDLRLGPPRREGLLEIFLLWWLLNK
jgi:hypothetical protein